MATFMRSLNHDLQPQQFHQVFLEIQNNISCYSTCIFIYVAMVHPRVKNSRHGKIPPSKSLENEYFVNSLIVQHYLPFKYFHSVCQFHILICSRNMFNSFCRMYFHIWQKTLVGF